MFAPTEQLTLKTTACNLRSTTQATSVGPDVAFNAIAGNMTRTPYTQNELTSTRRSFRRIA